MSFKRTLRKQEEKRQVKSAKDSYREGYHDGVNRMIGFIAQRLEEVRKVPGIGEKRFAKILEILDFQDKEGA